jgi:uncharacterized protein (TIGR02145 family)
MKARIFILVAVLSFAATALTAQESKTTYVMKNGEIICQFDIADIDSMIFYHPSSVKDPSTFDEGVVVNGVKWATRNVAAPGIFVARPEDRGMFYQWNRKIGWSFTNPVVNTNGGTTWNSNTPTGTTWEKSNDPSPIGWRVPTLNEIKTLLDSDKVSSEWITQNGANGRKFTDKVTGNSIFLPVAGLRLHSNGTLWGAGSDGYYWSSTAVQFDETAYNIYFFSDNISWSVEHYRGCGFNVRAVAE